MSTVTQTEASALVDPQMAVAVYSAVAQSIAAAESLEIQVKRALAAFDPLLRGSEDEGGTPEAVQLLRNALSTAHTEAADLFERQRKALGTVNLALFGRTGAGKSSLIEALSHGAGTSISTGESDFTVKVTPTNWRGVQFMDTPGICGWGRSMKRDDLEARARQAAEIADIVVLCFDSQNQQAAEFEKIGTWVKEFGKPVIAVLNIRNPHWRWPAKVALGSRRRQLAQMTHEHVSNISTELATIGLHSVPVIAIAAQRAVYARAAEDYTGPLPEQCHKMREMLGREVLLHQSNLVVFESVVIEALTSHAVDIRLGMLHAQVRALLERLTGLLREAGAAAQTSADALDRAIKSMLEIVGYPPQGSARRAALATTSTGEDLLTAAEQARGEAYTLSAEGRAARYTRQRCGSEFGALRSKSITAANHEVNDCFDRRCELNAEVFAQRVYDDQLINETAKTVLTEGAEHLRRELKLSLEDAKLDLEFSAHQAFTVAGDAGTAKRHGGLAARVVAMLARAATVLAVIPEPVISKGVALVLGIAASVVGWLGEWLTGKAKTERENAKFNAVAEATRSVYATYDRIAEQIETSMDYMLESAGNSTLTLPLQNATALLRLTAATSQAAVQITGIITALPETTNAQRALVESARMVAGQRSSEPVQVEHVLLGEDWITDPTGLTADTGSADPQRTRIHDPGIFDRLFEGFRKFVFRFTGKVQRGAGEKWLTETESALATEEWAAAPLSELRQMLVVGKPRYHLLGDYSTGKTSFIKRLLMDAGLPLPATLEVRADPATDTIHTYEWENALLVDSPGLQSSKSSHTVVALNSVPDASVLICLFQPNLLVGHTTELEQLLKGDATKGIAAKLGRTIFVIHRADELGPDPEVVPQHYVRACERKTLELQQALASKGIIVELERIVCMAADPRSMVGNRRDANSTEFDSYRHWDGFKEFHSAIRAIHAQSAATGLDFTLLEGGLARLGHIAARFEAEAGALRQCGVAFASQHRVFNDITCAAKLLEGDLKDQARKLVQDYAQGLRAQEVANDYELRAKVARLAEWWLQPDFQVQVEQWQSAAQKKIESWWQDGSERLNRTLNSPRFKAAAACASQMLDQSAYKPDKPGPIKRMMEAVATPLKGATRDAVYKIGKALGQNFKPYGAVKLAKNLGRVGVGLSTLLTAWDAVKLFNFFKNEKREQQREQQREQDLDDFITQTTEQVFRSITQSEDGSQGPLEALGVLKQELQAAGSALERDRDAINEKNERLHARRLRIRACMNAAWTALGQSPPTP